jgi:ferrous iron transport protein B
VLICVADATNLRLVLRLALELKQVGRPFVLALNMFDIAQRQGLRIDLEKLSAEIGAPIVTTVATRKRGLEELVAQVEALSSNHAGETANTWREPDAARSAPPMRRPSASSRPA